MAAQTYPRRLGLCRPDRSDNAGALYLSLPRQALQLRLSRVPQPRRPAGTLETHQPRRDRHPAHRRHDDGPRSKRQRHGLPSPRLRLFHRSRSRGGGRRNVTRTALFLLSLTLQAQSLTGVVDFHVHSDPDSVPRSIDAIDATRLAKERGLRGVVLKNHYEPTASLAYLARKAVPGIEVFGGIALNRTVGGINPAAVERLTMVKGGYG